MDEVLVIGAGAAGMMAAIAAGEAGAQVRILEKMPSPGRKLALTGKGRCNLTTNKNREGFLAAVKHNPRFLYAAWEFWDNQEVCRFFEKRGCPLKVERGERVFPASDVASDVIGVLVKAMKAAKVCLETNQAVVSIERQADDFWQVKTEKKTFQAKAVILATGGLSYPGTGSTGDGYGFAKQLGLMVTKPRPALVPLVCEQGWPQAAQGLSLKNVRFRLALPEGKTLYDGFGEVMCTHFGLSGPLVLTSSGLAVDWWQKNKGPLVGQIDLKPALTEKQLDERILREIQEMGKRQLKNGLKALLPQKLILPFLAQVDLSPEKPLFQLSRVERRQLVYVLKNMKTLIIGHRPLSEAIVTAGGVAVKQVVPKTMAAKPLAGFYLAGEILDVDGDTGGHNLQIAFSTGRLAGASAAQYLKERGDLCKSL